MAAIHGSMPAFELFQPASVDDALALLARHRANAWVLAGGLDTLEWLADRIKRPTVLVDLAGIAGLSGVRETPQGVEIGAMTTLAAIATEPVITGRYRLLADAAMAVASPQIRNQGTIGGNVSQSARCWYYRAGWPCYRAGGNICYADTPTGANREHAIFDLDRCVAVNPSDTAPALVALDAEMVVRSPRGERVVPADDFFVGPATEITRMTALEPGELLTAIRLPARWAGAQFYFEKVRDRQVWDFALVNIAAALQTAGGAIRDLRLVVNGVAARPKRLRAVEAAVRGKPRSEATAQAAGDLAMAGAEPLRHNAYKVALTRNLVRRAIRGAGGALTT
jgi:xanthine dehydrogenase YagS FAD-binding subunit